MPFGQNMKQFKPQEKKATEGTFQRFISPVLDLKPGTRIFRFLPTVKDGTVLYNDIKEPDTAAVVFYAEYWIPVNDSKSTKNPRQQRVFVGHVDRFNNYLWNDVYQHLDKEIVVGGKLVKNNARALAKIRFAANVYNRTNVIETEDGGIVYANPQGEYLDWNSDTRKIDLELDRTKAKPHNSIIVLEGSAGETEEGKHLYAQLKNLYGNVMEEDEQGHNIVLPLTAFDIRIVTTKTGPNTNDVARSINQGSLKPLPNQDQIWLQPRYDLESFYTPWPDSALEEAYNGEDINAVFERYDLLRVPAKEDSNDDIPF